MLIKLNLFYFIYFLFFFLTGALVAVVVRQGEGAVRGQRAPGRGALWAPSRRAPAPHPSAPRPLSLNLEVSKFIHLHSKERKSTYYYVYFLKYLFGCTWS